MYTNTPLSYVHMHAVSFDCVMIKGPFVSRVTVAWNHSYSGCLHNLYKF